MSKQQDIAPIADFGVTIEEMTADEYKNGGENLTVNYSFAESPFGAILVAATPKGLCYMAFADDTREALDTLRAQFPNASYHPKTDAIQQKALSVFSRKRDEPVVITCHLKGTAFQLKVWEALLKIPMGRPTTYGDIAVRLNHPGASRAVGSAVGHNPVSLVIPCHRVIRSSGQLGGYHWGLARKAAILEWESSLVKE